MADQHPAEGTVHLTFVDEQGNTLHESESVAVPRIGDEVMIATEKVRLGPLGWARAAVGMLGEDSIPDPAYWEGKVVRVLWCLLKDFDGVQSVTIVVKLEETSA